MRNVHPRGHTHTAESPFKPSTRSLRDQHQTGRDHSVIRASARSPRRSCNTRAKGSDRRPAPRPLKLPRASTQREGWHCTGSAILPSLADSAQYRTRPALRLPISKKRNRRTCKRSGHPASRSDGLRMSSLQRVAPTRKPRDAQGAHSVWSNADPGVARVYVCGSRSVSLDLHNVSSKMFELCGFRSISCWEGGESAPNNCYVRRRYWNCPDPGIYSIENFHPTLNQELDNFRFDSSWTGPK